MITEPLHPTEQYIEGRIAFNEAGAAYYDQHCQTGLAKWSRQQIQVWAEKLMALRAQGREAGDGE